MGYSPSDLKPKSVGPGKSVDNNRQASLALVVFTTRVGGVSQPPFNSLNLGLNLGDYDDRVLKNRHILATALGLEVKKFTFAQQVHGDRILNVDESQVGSGSDNFSSSLPATDGLITKLRKTPLVLLYADCLPVVVIGLKHVAVIHAGWRGLMNGIIIKAVSWLADLDKCPLTRLKVILGPSIRGCCYEIGASRLQDFKSRFPKFEFLSSAHLDLAVLARHSLVQLGLEPGNIKDIGLCTHCHPKLFYSYRRSHQTGRQAALVAKF